MSLGVKMREHFRAPWGRKLQLTTAVFLVICLAVLFTVQNPGRYVVLGIVFVAALFAVRGYSVLDGKLLVHRLGWATKFDLSTLSSAEVSPGASMGSVRALGIGGLFGFVGRYRNEVLGLYRAYATNDLNTVVLDFGGEKVVVTPDDPEQFVEVVQAMRAGQRAANAEEA
jgi:hypothetical protein